MMNIMVTLEEQTVADVSVAAIAKNMTFNEYVEWRLNVELDAVAEETPQPLVHVAVDDVAKAILKVAIKEPCDEDGGGTYLVEELYKRNGLGKEWSMLDRGNRIAIGKAFKRIVDAQLKGGTEVEDGRRMKVERAGLTQQNQALYRTVRAG